MTFPRRIALDVLLAIVVIPIALFVRVHIAENAWASSFGPIESLPVSVPIAQNESAGRMAGWIARLGGGEVTEAIPMSPSREPSTAVRDYVDAHQADLDQVAEEIARNPPPAWPISFDWRGPITNLAAAGRLQRALLTAAMLRLRSGDERGALPLFLASWRINESLRDRPELFAQFYAIAAFRMQCAILRTLNVDPVAWRPRVQEHDYRASMRTACKFLTWNNWRYVRENIYAKPEYRASLRNLAAVAGTEYRYRPQWLLLATTPRRWFDLPSVLEGSREVLLAAARTPVRDGDISDLAAEQQSGFSKWLYTSDPDVQPPRIAELIRRADRAAAEGELTEKILLAKVERARNGGNWPASIDGFERTKIANGKWIYERTATGVSIHFSRNLQWNAIGGDPVQMTYSAPN